MKLRQTIGNLVALAFFGACVYAFMQWQGGQEQGSESSAFAERACVDEIDARYNVSNVRTNSVRESASGFVVRASVTTSAGSPAMALCVTNSHGGVTDVSIRER